MLSLRNSGYVAVSNVTQGEQLDYNHYGIDDDDGPVPVLQQDFGVNVPNTTVALTQEQERLLDEARDVLRQSGDGDRLFKLINKS